MNRKIIASLVAAALAAPAALAFAADDMSKNTMSKDTATSTNSTSTKVKNFVKDSAVTARVKTALAKEKFSTLVKINVDTTATGEVTLSGTAPTKADADHAESVAKGVNGVTSVENNITVAAAK